ncbi:Uncharacterised protein [Enterobacter hormaechei]|nr:Uncharacterised protein [Enterobacter hormaechei]
MRTLGCGNRIDEIILRPPYLPGFVQNRQNRRQAMRSFTLSR